MLTATNRSNIKISKEIELKRFSEKTSRFAKKFNTFFLYGELGVGKTTFAKYLINNLQKKEKIMIFSFFCRLLIKYLANVVFPTPSSPYKKNVLNFFANLEVFSENLFNSISFEIFILLRLVAVSIWLIWSFLFYANIISLFF